MAISLTDRLPAAVVLVRGCYTAALPVVLTRVCRATSHEPPLLDFAARPGKSSAQGLAQSLTFAHPVVTYIQYEYYYSAEER